MNEKLFSVCFPSFEKYLKIIKKKTHLSLMFALYFALQNISHRIENVKLALRTESNKCIRIDIAQTNAHIPTIHDGNA